MEEVIYLIQGKQKSQRDYLLKSLDAYNEEKSSCGEATVAIPEDAKDATEKGSNEIELYNLDVSTNTTILRNAGVRTRQGGISLNVGGLRRRIRQVWENRANPNYFEPSIAGINRREYWLPIVKELITGVCMVFGTILLTRQLYVWAEHYHAQWECVDYGNFYSMWCYAVKKSRTYLEELNYNMVYTALIGVGAFVSKILFAYQKQFNKYFEP